MTSFQLPDHYGFYGVFDGHIGYDAAAYCTQHMARNLAESPQFPDKPHLAFIDAFATTDKGFNATVRGRRAIGAELGNASAV